MWNEEGKEVLRWVVFSSWETPVIVIIRPLLEQFSVGVELKECENPLGHKMKWTLLYQIWVGLSDFPEWEAKLEQVNCRKKRKSLIEIYLDSAECQKTSVDANEVKEWVECQSNSMQVNKVATSSKVQLKLIWQLQDGEQTAVSLWRPHVTPPSWLLNHTFTTFPVKLSAETVSLWMMDFAKFREESWPADTHTVLALAWWQPKPFYSWCHFMLS